MAKKEAPKPFYPLKHEFVASLDNFAQQAGMLADCIRTLLQHDVVPKNVVDILRERLDAFDKARHGDSA